MASPLVTSPIKQSSDPTRNGRYALRVAESVRHPRRADPKFASIKFNHKPKSSSRTQQTTFTQDGGSANLTIHEPDDEGPSRFEYAGTGAEPKQSYILVFDQATQQCTLEQLSTAYSFNLTSTPWEKSSKKLAEQYPQVRPTPTGKGPTEDEPDETELDDDSDPDPENPFDYRHFLQHRKSPSPEPSHRAGGGTPSIGGKPLTPTTSKTEPATRTAAKPPAARKPAAAAVTKHTPTLPESPAPTTTVPAVRLDRRASIKQSEPAKKKAPPKPSKPTIKSSYYVEDSSESDEADASPPPRPSGGLEIDFGGDSGPDSARKRRPFRFAGASAGDGPISLRSAADSTSPASPASARHTPPPHSRAASGEVIDFGDVGGGEGAEDSDDEASGGEDRDIDPFSLGPPAHGPRPTEQRSPEDEAMDDMEADLEAELMRGLQDQQEEDESDVSEEE